MKYFLSLKRMLAFIIIAFVNVNIANSQLPQMRTFKSIIEHSLFMKSGHESYQPFHDDEFKILKVTNLNESGEGSFRWAVEQKGPRIVVFEVGGVIDLNQKRFNITEPYLFVAGQTAPSPGITFIKGGFSVKTHDVIIQHIVVRTGDCNIPATSKWQKDALTTVGAYNVVIDHCTFTWATDENLSASGPSQEGPDKTSNNLTFSNCIIAEGLCQSTHPKGVHSMGTLVHDYIRNIAIVRNLYSQNNQRNPFLKPNVRAFIANNLIYNPKSRAIHSSWPIEEYVNSPDSLRRAEITVIGNVVIPGVDTPDELCLIQGPLKVYQKENAYIEYAKSKVNIREKILDLEVEQLPYCPIWTNKYKSIKTNDVANHILRYVGARPKFRDPIDQRIICDVVNKTGKVINSQEDVGGYPTYSKTTHQLIIPNKGIENWLEQLSKDIIK